MARTPSTELHWEESDPTAVIAAMDQLAAGGRGWINLCPEIVEGWEPPPRTLFGWLFSSRGEPVPLITWEPAGRDGGRSTVGIEHGAGPRALARLDEAGVERPAGSWRRADHARRGLVLDVEASTDVAEILDWAVRAAHVLSPAPLTGWWLATVYRPTG